MQVVVFVCIFLCLQYYNNNNSNKKCLSVVSGVTTGPELSIHLDYPGVFSVSFFSSVFFSQFSLFAILQQQQQQKAFQFVSVYNHKLHVDLCYLFWTEDNKGVS